jgi:rieske iron-sulfur protein
MRWFLGIGAVSSVAALASVLGTVRLPEAEQGSPEIEVGDPLVFALGTNKGQAIERTSILPGQAALAFPKGKEGQENLIMVIHLNPADLSSPTQLDWAPEGFVAYSAICTHLGCTVNFSHEAMPGVPYPHIHCPCHDGIYNPAAGAQVIAGPPPRPLPQLPLRISAQGELEAAGSFNAPVGVI